MYILADSVGDFGEATGAGPDYGRDFYYDLGATAPRTGPCHPGICPHCEIAAAAVNGWARSCRFRAEDYAGLGLGHDRGPGRGLGWGCALVEAGIGLD